MVENFLGIKDVWWKKENIYPPLICKTFLSLLNKRKFRKIKVINHTTSNKIWLFLNKNSIFQLTKYLAGSWSANLNGKLSAIVFKNEGYISSGKSNHQNIKYNFCIISLKKEVFSIQNARRNEVVSINTDMLIQQIKTTKNIKRLKCGKLKWFKIKIIGNEKIAKIHIITSFAPNIFHQNKNKKFIGLKR